jgi:hypothetical protein
VAKALRVDPFELRVTAESLSSHAEAFSATHEQAQSRAEEVALGASKAAAALPAMLTEWQTAGTRFVARHIKHADGHRAAADAYTQTDGGESQDIEAAGRAL